MKYSIAIVCAIKGSEFCYNKKVLTQNNKININPLATNATIVALVIKNEITYITTLRILDTQNSSLCNSITEPPILS